MASVQDARASRETCTTVRAARPGEAEALTDLALRSKAHWGYDADFLDACRDELTVTPERIRSAVAFVAERDGEVVGFAVLDVRGDEADIGFFFVEPETIGSGCGHVLWEHAVAQARARGLVRLTIESDPYAEGFYLRMGAERIGSVPSGAIPGRELPLLAYPLEP